MKFSFAMPNSVRVKALTQPFELDVTGADQVVMAKRAEELGYDMIPIPEHFVVPTAHVELSGPHYFHSTVAQAFIAGATQRIRVNSTVTLLPLQHPVIMAKALSTADWMSGGRITVTFGVGWDAEEFKILGVPFHERGRMADEYLAAIVELWTSDSPEFDGKYVSFKDVAFEPKPVQKPHLPIWIGGDAEPMLKRAARYASGWFPWLTSPAAIPAKIDFI
jgi:probable F420-dependent oxidoreductase